MEDVVVIPAYQPDETLVRLVDELYDNGFGILIVDDGSGKGYKEIFNRVSQKATVIAHNENLGKGAALKTGFKAIKNIFPYCKYVITSDADGQHRIGDILRVKQELHNQSTFVLTVRKRKNKIPFLSRFGNDLSKIVYTTLTSHYFSDNQSGLRGFSAKHLDWILLPKGNKYDYEMNMLFYADKQGIPITTIPIEAIYIDDNKSSHFNPLKDTFRIYKLLFSSAWASFAVVVLCEILIGLISIFFGGKFIYITVTSAGILSAFVGIMLNRLVIFRKVHYGDGTRTIIYTILRFAIYTAGCMLMNMYFPNIPLFFSFNIVAVLFVPLKYYVNKGIHFTEYHDINKEKE